jgi:anion-transporting  ArsA/GET3 family ATPase
VATANTPHLNTKLISVLGAGGVGKTTCAAAISLALADDGLRCVVITVDPARRLAGALGLDSLNSEPQRVYNSPTKGSTDALWLSQNQGLSELVNRRVSSNSQFAEVKNHRLFKIIESQLGGIEEYLGIERILSLAQSGNYDVCILDTPPSRHALDFFESPRHILRFFDDGVLRHFIRDEDEEAKKTGFFSRILQKRGAEAFGIFRNFLGSTFVQELSTLLAQLKPVRDLLRETATSIESWLASDHSNLVLCSTVETYALRETTFLANAIREKKLRQSELLILNRCIDPKLPLNQIEDFVLEHPNSASASLLKQKAQIQKQRIDKSSASFTIWAKSTALVPRLFFEEDSLDSLRSLGRTILDQWPNNPAKKASTTY